ncbi:MAG: NAD(P)-dependent dehydrogenase (short-subunit alcohol dehydrogenase family) [Halieaceae bacterium]|jgi:NAD(P)-dependent dehydrogenase (short-subunit alcohol dehydrogenase family)
MAAAPDKQAYRLLITGATGGMGKACALLAAEAGYDVILADLSLDKLEALAGECARHNVEATVHRLDVTQADSVEHLLSALAQGSKLNAVIHTVGLSPQMASWERIIEVDLTQSLALLENLRSHLKPGSCAVCISSMSGYLVPENAEIEQVLASVLEEGFLVRLQELAASFPMLEDSGMAYAYAKKAMRDYVSAQAPAWGGEGKRLVSISPGMINTEMGQLENEAMDNYEAMRNCIALDRLGEAEDIANTALFLISDKANYITGCDILVDGGFIANVGQLRR